MPVRSMTRYILLAAVLVLPGSTTSASPQNSSSLQIRPPVAALLDSAEAASSAGQLGLAKSLYEQVLESDSVNVAALLGLGRILSGIVEESGRAVELLRAARRAAPEDPRAHYWLGMAYLSAGTDVIGYHYQAWALDEFRQTLRLDPTHPDGAYQAGLLLREPFERERDALPLFQQQVDSNPSHPRARYELLRCLVEAGDWSSAITVGTEQIHRHPRDPDAYPWLAGAYWKSDRLDDAMSMFEAFFAVASDRERECYFDLTVILTMEEMIEYRRLDEEGERRYWDLYWRKRDPDPRTAINERLLEHLVRVAWARVVFGEKRFPWDDRGAMYVRYGEPDARAGANRPYATSLILGDWDFHSRRRDLYRSLGLSPPRFVPMFDEDPAASLGRVDGSGTPEQWFYRDRGIHLTFESPTMGGRYQLRRSPFASQLRRKIPVLSELEDEIGTLEPLETIVTFRAPEGKTELLYVIGLLPDDYGAFRSETGEVGDLDVDISLLTPQWHPAGAGHQRSVRLVTEPQFRLRDTPVVVDQTRFQGDPGDHVISVLVMDPVSGRRSARNEGLTLPDYSGRGLSVSDILPAVRIRRADPRSDPRFVRGDLEVLPLPGDAFDRSQHLFVYYEVYNLLRDSIGATSWQVTYTVSESVEEVGLVRRLYKGIRSITGAGRRPVSVSATITNAGIRRDVETWLELDLSALTQGVYELQLTVMDLIAGKKATSGMRFILLPGA